MNQWIVSLLLSLFSACALAADDPLIFAVNEGSSYRVLKTETKARYDGIAEDLSKLLHRRVQLEAVDDYAMLDAGLAEKRYAIAYVHPAHISIRAITRGDYRLVALTKGYVDYRATFFVPAASPLRSLADLKGKKLAAPGEDSITSWMIRATLRDTFGPQSPTAIQYTRYQDAIPFMVEHGFADSGSSAAPAVVSAWVGKGGRIIGASKAVPIKHLIAASSLPAEQFKLVQGYFLNLEGSEAGRARLERIQSQGFTGFDDALLAGLGKWLGV